MLIERVRDRNRYVREAAVRALGRIRDSRRCRCRRAVPAPGRAAPGVVYDALISFGVAAAPMFAEALRFGDRVRPGRVLLRRRAVSEPSRQPRSWSRARRHGGAGAGAAAEALGQVGGGSLPAGLARATRDEVATVRVAATRALGVLR